MKLSIVAGATSQSCNLFIQDFTGNPLTGLVFNSANLTAYYTFTGTNASSTVISLVTLAAVNSAYSSGGFIQLDSTNMPGWYRFDIPNTALASAKGRVVSIHFRGAANMSDLPLELALTGWDNQNATTGGLSALPNAAPGVANGLFIAGTNAPVTITGAGTALTLTSTGLGGRGVLVQGNGAAAGFESQGGATGAGLKSVGGGTSGAAVSLTTTSGDCVLCAPTGGVGFNGQFSATSLDLCTVAGQTLRDALRHIGATTAGKISGAGTGTETFLDFAAGTAVTVTVDGSGNRTAVVYA